jgi:hypothetical protein
MSGKTKKKPAIPHSCEGWNPWAIENLFLRKQGVFSPCNRDSRFRGKGFDWIVFSILLLLLFTPGSQAQNKELTLNGYVKDLFMLYKSEQTIPGLNKDLLALNTIHNRLNMRWYASEKLTAVIEMRNRIFAGSLISEYPPYKDMVDTHKDFFDLSFVPVDQGSWFMHSMIDRAYLDWTSGKWQVTLGRQRINWGINLVWNPNDVFNTFSYFDFDYEERPGTDAVAVKYYTGLTSSAEVVYKPGDSPDEMALAGRYRFSKWSYDFQAIGGWVGPDLILGAGWAGDIKGGGFRGELTHYFPKDDDSEEATVVSVSGDYTLPNSLCLHTGFLYSSHGKTGKAGGIDPLFNQNLSSKYLSLARYALFGQVSYPVTPLLHADLSGILNPGDGSCYAGPSFTYSLHTNLELMLTGQFFFGEDGSEFGDIGQLYFARLRWSF